MDIRKKIGIFCILSYGLFFLNPTGAMDPPDEGKKGSLFSNNFQRRTTSAPPIINPISDDSNQEDYFEQIPSNMQTTPKKSLKRKIEETAWQRPDKSPSMQGFESHQETAKSSFYEIEDSVVVARRVEELKNQPQEHDKTPYAKILALAPSYPVELFDKCSPKDKPYLLMIVEKILRARATHCSLAYQFLGNKLTVYLLSALSANTHITSLALQLNGIIDVSAFTNNTTLTSLNLEDNCIQDVSTFANNTTLTSLNLKGNCITDMSIFANNTVLTSWQLCRNKITDASPFAGNTTLKSLDLSWNKIANVSPLTVSPTLTSLDLSRNKIIDVSPFAFNPTLTLLNLSGNKITDVSPFSVNTTLTSLALGGNKIIDVSPFAFNTAIKSLELCENKIMDVSFLALNTTLTSLSLRHNKITSISPFENNTTLIWLKLDNNLIPQTENSLIRKIFERNIQLSMLQEGYLR